VKCVGNITVGSVTDLNQGAISWRFVLFIKF